MPQLQFPDGSTRDYPYDEQGMAEYRRDKMALELQQGQQGQQGPPGGMPQGMPPGMPPGMPGAMSGGPPGGMPMGGPPGGMPMGGPPPGGMPMGQPQQGQQGLPAETGQMGYMQSMRAQGGPPHQSDDMAAWHTIYDLMQNPALQAQLGPMQESQLNQMIQPLRDQRNPHILPYRQMAEPAFQAPPQGPPQAPPQGPPQALAGSPRAMSARRLLQERMPGGGQPPGQYR